MRASPGTNAPLPPWLEKQKGAAGPGGGGGVSLGWLRAPALLLAGVAIGWVLHAWRQPAPAPPLPIVAVEPPQCPASIPCGAGVPAGGPAAAHPAHAHAKTPARPLALRPLPKETPISDENRREALRAFAQAKASDLRSCLGDPGRGPLRRVGAALEIDSHGAVAAVQILGGEGASRAVDSCYSARLRAWRFPQALLQGDERLLVNFIL
jgi:hypothetical protein